MFSLVVVTFGHSTPNCGLFSGIVTVDPEVPLDKTLMPSPPSRPKNPVFENEEKSKVRCFLLMMFDGRSLYTDDGNRLCGESVNCVLSKNV